MIIIYLNYKNIQGLLLLTLFIQRQEMQKVISAIKQLLEISTQNNDSPLKDIKKVFFGDPILIPESDLPAITIQPISSDYTMRGSQYDQKNHRIEIRLLYNAKMYMDKNLLSEISISSASWTWWIVTISANLHWLQAWQTVQISWSIPDKYNGAFFVASVIDSNTFTVSMITDPWIYIWSWKIKQTINDKVFAIEDSINKIEQVWLNHETAWLTVCGTIQKNSWLPLTDANGTKKTAEIAKVESVSYSFSQDRGFPTFEVVTTVSATVIGDR